MPVYKQKKNKINFFVFCQINDNKTCSNRKNKKNFKLIS